VNREIVKEQWPVEIEYPVVDNSCGRAYASVSLMDTRSFHAWLPQC